MACQQVTDYFVQYSRSSTTASATAGGSGFTLDNNGFDMNTVINEMMKVAKKKEVIREGGDDKRSKKVVTVTTTQLLRNSIECLVMMRILKKCRKGKETVLQLDDSVLEREIKPLFTLHSMLAVFQ